MLIVHTVGLGGTFMRGSRKRERGAALVEFALLLPLLLMLLVGMVSVGLAYNHQISLTHAAREAGRFGATLPIGGDIDSWLASVAERAIEDATGSLSSDAPGRYVCVALVDGSGAPPDSARRLVLEGSAETGTPEDLVCDVSDVSATHQRVQVLLRRETNFTAVIFSTTIELDAQAVSRFEAAVGGT